jgi:ATP-dependent Clp protease ATP-binding subunit ClpC
VIIDRLTARARNAVGFSAEEAHFRNQSEPNVEHLLLALLRDDSCAASRILASLRVPEGQLRANLDPVRYVDPPVRRPKGVSKRYKKVLELSLRESLNLKQSVTGTEHLLLGIAREGTSHAAQVLVGCGATRDRIQEASKTLSQARTGPSGPPLVFQAPPGWPPPPEGFVPDLSWRPSPDWPAPPPGWSFWRRG